MTAQSIVKLFSSASHSHTQCIWDSRYCYLWMWHCRRNPWPIWEHFRLIKPFRWNTSNTVNKISWNPLIHPWSFVPCAQLHSKPFTLCPSTQPPISPGSPDVRHCGTAESSWRVATISGSSTDTIVICSFCLYKFARFFLTHLSSMGLSFDLFCYFRKVNVILCFGTFSRRSGKLGTSCRK